MNDAEKLAALRRLLDGISYIDIGRQEGDQRWCIIDGGGWMPAEDVAVLEELLDSQPADA